MVVDVPGPVPPPVGPLELGVGWGQTFGSVIMGILGGQMVRVFGRQGRSDEKRILGGRRRHSLGDRGTIFFKHFYIISVTGWLPGCFKV